MSDFQSTKKFDLEERTFIYGQKCLDFIKLNPRTLSNLEHGPQLICYFGSVGANYIEANESLSRKDFIMRIKICRKESKESRYWSKLIDFGNNENTE